MNCACTIFELDSIFDSITKIFKVIAAFKINKYGTCKLKSKYNEQKNKVNKQNPTFVVKYASAPDKAD